MTTMTAIRKPATPLPQSRMDFARDEWKKLSDVEKAEIKAGLEKNGYEIVAAA